MKKQMAGRGSRIKTPTLEMVEEMQRSSLRQALSTFRCDNPPPRFRLTATIGKEIVGIHEFRIERKFPNAS